MSKEMNMFGDEPAKEKQSKSAYVTKPKKVIGDIAKDFESIDDTSGEYQPLRGQIFRRWMGTKEICQSFLRAVCDKSIKVKDVKTEVSFINRDLAAREIRVDVITEDENFNIYDIEAQERFYSQGHEDRRLYYFSVIFGSQLKTGDEFSLLKKTTVIFINLHNSKSNRLVDEIELRYVHDPTEAYTDKLKIIEINLNNMTFDTDESEYSKEVKLFALFCLIGERTHSFDFLRGKCGIKDKELDQLANQLRYQLNRIKGETPVHALSKEDEPIIIEKREELTMFNRAATLAEGIERGIAEGIEKGIERGIEKGIEEVVMKIYKKGKSVKDIADLLEMSEEEIKKIIEEFNNATEPTPD